MTPNTLQKEAKKIFGKNLLTETKDGITTYRYIVDVPKGLLHGYFVRYIFSLRIEGKKLHITWYNCNDNTTIFGCVRPLTLEVLTAEFQRFAEKLTEQKGVTITSDDLNRYGVKILGLKELTQKIINETQIALLSNGYLSTIPTNTLQYLTGKNFITSNDNVCTPEKVGIALRVLMSLSKILDDIEG